MSHDRLCLLRVPALIAILGALLLLARCSESPTDVAAHNNLLDECPSTDSLSTDTTGDAVAAVEPSAPVAWSFPTQAMADAWWLLDVYFVFRNLLPSQPDSYDSPVDLFQSVDEPWTNYYPHDLAVMYVALLNNERGGIGIILDSTARGPVITDVFPGSPGEQAGLAAGDTIVAVDGRPTAGEPIDSVGSWLSGEIGESRSLTVQRESGTVTIVVTLGTYNAPSVFTDSLDTATAYIAMTSFSRTTVHADGTAGEFREALEKTAWADYTIFDLRDNGGGSVSQCLDVLGELVPQATPVIRSREREYVSAGDSGITVDTTWYTSRHGGIAQQRRMYVLVSEYTASASEIVVSCLREQRPDIVSLGMTTYGKARSQYVFGYDFANDAYYLTDSAIATVTFAVLSPVSAPTYDLIGITPDHLLATGTDALEEAMELIGADQSLGVAKARVPRRKLAYLERARRAIRPERHVPLAVYDLHPGQPWAP